MAHYRHRRYDYERRKLLVTAVLAAVTAVSGVAFWVGGISRRSQTRPAPEAASMFRVAPRPRQAVTLVATPMRIALARPTATEAPAPSATPAPTRAPIMGVTFVPTLEATQPAYAEPIFAPNADLGDGRPSYVCSVNTQAGAHILQLIQTAGLDLRHGFHLGILVLPDAQTRPEDALDCQVTTLDRVALLDSGVVTLVVGESAGADAIWSRNLTTLDALQGKRLAVVSDSASEYFALAALQSRAALAAGAVDIVRYPSGAEALRAYRAGEADAISIRAPVPRGDMLGRPLVSTRDIRSVVDVVVTSQRSIDMRAEVVQAFHRAWFAAIHLQSTDFPAAARLIASWGRAELTGIGMDTAQRDLRAQLNGLAQADLRQNVVTLTRGTLLTKRAADAAAAWRRAGRLPAAAGGVRSDASFARAAADAVTEHGADFRAVFPNASYSLADEGELALAPTIAVIDPPQTPQPLSLDRAP